MDIDRFEQIAEKELSSLPEEFFHELHGGVIISEEEKLSPEDIAHDLYTLGTYKRSALGNMITLYYGSFSKKFAFASEDVWESKIREVIRHEFRHHLENLSGIHNSESLEAEDARELAKYREKHSQRSNI